MLLALVVAVAQAWEDMTDAVEQFRVNFLTACHCQDDAVPVPTSSIVSMAGSHSEDYPSPAITEYLDEGLEAAALVPCAEVWKAIRELRKDAACYRQFQAARLLDLLRVPLKPEEAAKRLGVKVSRLYQMRRRFWEQVYARVATMQGP